MHARRLRCSRWKAPALPRRQFVGHTIPHGVWLGYTRTLLYAVVRAPELAMLAHYRAYHSEYRFKEDLQRPKPRSKLAQL